MLDLGSAVGHLLLDTTKWDSGVQGSKEDLGTLTQNTSTAGSKLAGVGNKLGSIGNKLTVGVTMPLVGIGTAAVKTASTFEASMSNLQAISGASAEEMDMLKAKAQEMGATTKFTASESAEALTYMAMAGWDTQSMLEGIGGVMSLAAASGEDLATTSDIVTDALTAFGLTAQDTQMFVDVLATAANSSNTNVTMLGESFKYVAPLAGSLGYSVQDVGATLGIMANSGIKASQAGTTLRGALSRLAKPTKQVSEYLSELGLITQDGVVTAMVNADGTMKPLRETLDILRGAFGNLTDAEKAEAASAIFGQEAMSGMLAVINASNKDFYSLIQTMDNASGTADEMANVQLDNLSGQMTLLKSGVESLMISLGEALMPVIKDVVKVIQNIVEWLNGLSDGQKEVIFGVMKFMAIAGPAMKAIKGIAGLMSMISTIQLPMMSTGFSKLAPSILIVAAAVAALLALLVALKGSKQPEPVDIQRYMPKNLPDPNNPNDRRWKNTGGHYASGLDYVPRDMGVQVHEGERILTKEENEAYSRGRYSGPEKITFEAPVYLDGQVIAHNQYKYNLKESSLRGHNLME